MTTPASAAPHAGDHQHDQFDGEDIDTGDSSRLLAAADRVDVCSQDSPRQHEMHDHKHRNHDQTGNRNRPHISLTDDREGLGQRKDRGSTRQDQRRPAGQAVHSKRQNERRNGEPPGEEPGKRARRCPDQKRQRNRRYDWYVVVDE